MNWIMLATDFSERSDRALRRATLLAREAGRYCLEGPATPLCCDSRGQEIVVMLLRVAHEESRLADASHERASVWEQEDRG